MFFYPSISMRVLCEQFPLDDALSNSEYLLTIELNWKCTNEQMQIPFMFWIVLMNSWTIRKEIVTLEIWTIEILVFDRIFESFLQEDNAHLLNLKAEEKNELKMCNSPKCPYSLSPNPSSLRHSFDSGA